MGGNGEREYEVPNSSYKIHKPRECEAQHRETVDNIVVT